MSNTAAYIYNRKDGGTTYCYGKLEEDANFDVICYNECYDGTWAERDPEVHKEWKDICEFLEANYNTRIEEISSDYAED